MSRVIFLMCISLIAMFLVSKFTRSSCRDLLALEANCTTTHAQFINGSLVTQKTTNKLSALAHDQVHEQLDAMVKGDGSMSNRHT